MCPPPPPQMVFFATLFGIILLENAGTALQIQCYQCEEMKQHDCSTPEYLVNCTVNVQDMCQKEVLVKEDGVHYRKSCASSGACLIASSGYQQFCTGKLNSVCITCCNTPLCNGPKKKRPVPNAATSLLLWSHRCSRTPPGPWGSFLLDLSSAGPLGPLLLPSLLVPMSVLFRM